MPTPYSPLHFLGSEPLFADPLSEAISSHTPGPDPFAMYRYSHEVLPDYVICNALYPDPLHRVSYTRIKRSLGTKLTHDLTAAGLPVEVLPKLREYIHITVAECFDIYAHKFVEAVNAQQENAKQDAGEQPNTANDLDTTVMRTATEIAQELKVSPETIYRRERKGELYSILPSGKKRMREYPAFQFWPEVQNQLPSVVSTLKKYGELAVHGFLTSRNELLGDLTPIEVLLGRLTSNRALYEENDLLSQAKEIRTKMVLGAAEAYAADMQ